MSEFYNARIKDNPCVEIRTAGIEIFYGAWADPGDMMPLQGVARYFNELFWFTCQRLGVCHNNFKI